MGQLFKDNKNYLFDDLVPMNSSSQALRLVKASTTTTTITTINQCKATYELRNLLFQQMRGTKRSRRQCPRNLPMENLCLSILNLSADSRSRPEVKLIIRSSAKRVWGKKIKKMRLVRRVDADKIKAAKANRAAPTWNSLSVTQMMMKFVYR